MRDRFRIIVVDDDIYKGTDNLEEFREGLSAGQHKGILGLLSEVLSLGKNDTLQVELFLCGSLTFWDEPATDVVAVSRDTDLPNIHDVTEALYFFASADVLILDLHGVGDLPERWRLDGQDLADLDLEVRDSDIPELNEELPGAAFYLKNRRVLSACGHVAFFTAWDQPESTEKYPSLVRRYLYPFCKGLASSAGIYRTRSNAEVLHLLAAVRSLFQARAHHFYLLNHRAIAFAASHSEPVMIVGESGTGKETIANLIHQRWKASNRARRLPMHVINCATLSPELARSELFGQIAGSFTGATSSRLGAILRACGVQPPAKITDDSPDVFCRSLLSSNRGRLKRVGSGLDLEFTQNEPLSTLFLDEFGELPSSVQALLLRYLDSATREVQPIGYPGRIAHANVRVLLATSDPRIARAAGNQLELKGSWRGREELNRPIRPDLILRVKGFVIRAEGITMDNYTEAVGRVIEDSNSTWHPDARTYLEGAILGRIKAVEEAMSQLSAGHTVEQLPLFGHWRELRQIVRLAVSHARARPSMGVRPVTDEGTVLEDDVRAVWQPGSISVQTAAPHSPSSGWARAAENSRWTYQDFLSSQIIRESTDEARLLELLFRNPDQSYTGEQIRSLANIQTKNIVSLASRLRRKLESERDQCGWTITTGNYKLQPVP